jgi:hypothetical protein
MKVLLLLNSNKLTINSVEDCKTRMELFMFMIKLHLQQYDNIELSIEKCFPCTEMKTTFKKKTINNFKKVDHIIFLDESGLYRKNPTFISHLKKKAHTISTFCKHVKFYNGEDYMFTYNNLVLNKHTYFIPPPLDKTIYTPVKDKRLVYILLDSKPGQLILEQIYNLISLNYENNNIIFKIGIINQKKVDFIDILYNGDDVIYNLHNSITFNIYIDYVYELAKANIFISSKSITDIYFLYELAMCNTLHVSKIGLVQNNIVNELDSCVFDGSIEINWKEIFNKLGTYNIRQTLIDNNYTWKNALNIMFHKLSQSTPNQPITNKEINKIMKFKQGYCLNIVDKKRPTVVNLHEIHKKRKEREREREIKQKVPVKRKIILQSELLKKKS